MSRSLLERRLHHDIRLEILCWLANEPLSLSTLSDCLGQPLATVAYHLGVLLSSDLIEIADGVEGDEDTPYAVSLDRHPPWVREAVAERKGLNSLRALRMMYGMKCDGCDRLLQYKAEIVAVYEKDGKRWTKIVTGDSPGFGEAASLRATEKYHRPCYAEARERDPMLPPVQG